MGNPRYLPVAATERSCAATMMTLGISLMPSVTRYHPDTRARARARANPKPFAGGGGITILPAPDSQFPSAARAVRSTDIYIIVLCAKQGARQQRACAATHIILAAVAQLLLGLAQSGNLLIYNSHAFTTLRRRRGTNSDEIIGDARGRGDGWNQGDHGQIDARR